MMYKKSDTKQLQAVLTDEERAVMRAVIQQSGMKQKYWLRKLILDAIHPNDTEWLAHLDAERRRSIR